MKINIVEFKNGKMAVATEGIEISVNGEKPKAVNEVKKISNKDMWAVIKGQNKKIIAKYKQKR
jgi:hypothetical protein